jgi:hypothetical protein
MSQEAVLDFLKKHKGNGKWYSGKEIAAAIKVSSSSIATSMAVLRHAEFVKYKLLSDIGCGSGKFIYHHKGP